MARTVFPYRRPDQQCADPSAWLVTAAGRTYEGPIALPGWDYNTDLAIARDVRIDLSKLREQSGLPTDAALLLAVVWESSGSHQRSRCFREKLPGLDGIANLQVDAHLRGEDLGGTLTLRTAIVLAEQVSTPEPFTAHLPGSELWSEEFRIVLEDDAPLFPVAMVDFAVTTFPLGTPWSVSVGSNPDSAAMGSLMLYINESIDAVAHAFRNAGDPTTADAVLLSAAHADVTRVLIEHALSIEELDSSIDYPEGSIGRMLQGVMHRIFPDEDYKSIRRRRDSQPAMFADEVHDAVRVFSEVR
ncbi:hypothetical protein [Tomitella fengzijianii]|uniref:Uncharacterized protein n=1 Tax=Tomitella fengzijianii TaxID=2597660 RepID=A0A516WZV3_9ACTN|nr:hypothetical protein [Tomitella fengzijianii]QDQ96342.1 hypothetical protein FO059_02000 [Tomitella fengzijianii]